MTEPQKHDWPQIIAELEAAGITVYKLSLMVRRPYGIVNSWRRGSEPKHFYGEMLLAIHAEYVHNQNPCQS